MPRRVMQGEVVANNSARTVVVRVNRYYTHPVLKKTIKRSKKYHAHTQTEEAPALGVAVRIRECAPRSKLKRWEVLADEPAAEKGTKKAQS